MARLGVNIDHVATLRNQRDEGYPQLERAAEFCLESGAEQITIHLREDRRHIRDADLLVVQNVTKKYNRLLNLEVGTDLEIAKIAGNLKPDWVCIVPEKREEKTTEGGLDLKNAKIAAKVIEVGKVIKHLSPNTKISLFIEGSVLIFNAVKEMSDILKIDAVEIHTGEYAKDILVGDDTASHINNFLTLKNLYIEEGIGYHAGHGLTMNSLMPLVEAKIFDEYNIGHWIISESVFIGIGEVVKQMKRLLQ